MLIVAMKIMRTIFRRKMSKCPKLITNTMWLLMQMQLRWFLANRSTRQLTFSKYSLLLKAQSTSMIIREKEGQAVWNEIQSPLFHRSNRSFSCLQRTQSQRNNLTKMSQPVLISPKKEMTTRLTTGPWLQLRKTKTWSLRRQHHSSREWIHMKMATI